MMINSLKKRFTIIYSILVIIIILVGLFAVINMYNINKSTNGLITNNYKSINTSNKMIDCINSQDKAILIYLQGNKDEALNLFHATDDEFYKWFYVEKSNITEPGELELVDRINSQYIEFSKLFSGLQDYNNGQNHDELVQIYYQKISPQIDLLNKSLKELFELNEDIMLKKEGALRSSSESSIYFIIFISLGGAIIGGSIAMFFTNRYFNPIHLLINTIKSVKAGDLNKQSPVIYDDEIGLLAKEFNNMTNRLYDFEKSTEGNLVAEKNRSLSIIKSISDPIILLDDRFRIKFINDEGKSFFNIDEEHCIDKSFFEVINLSKVYKYIKESINKGSENREELIEIKRNNKKYFFNITSTIIKGSEEKIDGVVVLFKNITGLKELEIIKADFIGTISHELKTPLTSIMMGVGLINDSNIGSLNSKQREILETIKEDVQKLNDLVSNLLKISHIQSNKTSFNIRNNDIKELIKNCLYNFIPLAKEKGIELKLNLEERLPDVMMDEEKIKWVLNNLLSNAVRYTEKGSIKIDGYIKENNICVSVTDTGRGIPSNYLEKVFERFVRVEGFEIPEESTGLGLSIAKEIVEIHGGKIWCESKVGYGSKFIFTIPLS
ncbi:MULTISPECIES: ATP-binding protein [unclassified Clostridium]|uniref:sensor histidine kinase n=1 Tax=unclassified Clostridium TaxID=2614128 RepID=UPI00189822C2|nr:MULTISPECIES: ATP-binding protein [unclassified Clostridium]MCR1952771.1 ATP-binding protein [Clostridium sp. DSM 100503]